MQECGLCTPNLRPLIGTEADWRLVLNFNQNLLGKCFWVLNRHEENVSDLTATEWAQLHVHIKDTVSALRSLWSPDHFNIVFLQNQDRHVHLHIIPRYASSRTIGFRTFDDLDYPSHYAVAGPSLGLPVGYRSPHDRERLTTAELEEIGDNLRRAYVSAKSRKS